MPDYFPFLFSRHCGVSGVRSMWLWTYLFCRPDVCHWI